MINFLKTNKKILLNLFSVLVVASLLWYSYQNRNAISALNNVTLVNALIISGCNIVMNILNGMLNHSMMIRLKKELSFSDSILIQYANNLLNKITPRGGIIFRGIYLYKTYDFEISRYLSTVAGVYIISFGTNAIIGLISSYMIYRQVGIYSLILNAFYLGVAILMFVLIIFTPKLKSNKGFILRNLDKMITGWNILKQDSRQVFYFIFITILIFLVTMYQQYVVYSGLGEHIDIWRLFYLSTISNLSLLVNITPGGIGIKEGILIFSSRIIDINSEILVLGSLVTRVVVFATSFLLGSISYFILIKKMNKKTASNIIAMSEEIARAEENLSIQPEEKE